jgi:hypothetical protein
MLTKLCRFFTGTSRGRILLWAICSLVGLCCTTFFYITFIIHNGRWYYYAAALAIAFQTGRYVGRLRFAIEDWIRQRREQQYV